MNKSELIAAIAEKTGNPKSVAEESLVATIEVISEQLQAGDSITLVGFGTFAVSNRNARVGRNPQTGAEIKIAAKKVVKFKTGKKLDESVNEPPKKRKPAAGKKK